jgi:hypothetical protein
VTKLAAFVAGVVVGVLVMLTWSLYVALHAGGTVPPRA